MQKEINSGYEEMSTRVRYCFSSTFKATSLISKQAIPL
uniref:Uncharacterized protein n=1 Tax=Anguilla anguilla TaxID=7936 RepID=A0A0E9V0S5_ANGAN